MKAALFNSVNYLGPAPTDVWPAPVDGYSTEIAERTLANAIEQFRLADDVGFDWVTVAEHHYGPFSLTPNPMVRAGALSQVIRNAKIALLGPNISIQNPVRVAEELAMLDTLTCGRIVVGMVRGTPNEYVTYNVNPAESRERFEEALQIIRAAWTQPQPFGWQGHHFEYRSISIWPRPVQKPHPPIYMSGSSPESGEFAARNHVGIAFAVTSVQRAAKAAEHYRRHAAEAGWTPTAEDVIYRLSFHVADTDDQAFVDLKSPDAIRRGTNVATANAAIESAVAEAGYYGRDIAMQRARQWPRAANGRTDSGPYRARPAPRRRPGNHRFANQAHPGPAGSGNPRPFDRHPARRQDASLDRAVRHESPAVHTRPLMYRTGDDDYVSVRAARGFGRAAIREPSVDTSLALGDTTPS